VPAVKLRETCDCKDNDDGQKQEIREPPVVGGPLTIVLFGLFSSNRLLSDFLFLTIIVVLAVTGLAEFYGLAQKRI